MIVLTLTATSQTEVKLIDPPHKIGTWYCFDLENINRIIQYEVTLQQCDLAEADYVAEITLLNFVIEQKDKQIGNLQEQIAEKDKVINADSLMHAILYEDYNSKLIDNMELTIKVNKLKNSRTGWIIGGVITVSVSVLITVIAIATP